MGSSQPRGRGRRWRIALVFGLLLAGCGRELKEQGYFVPDDLYAAAAVGSDHLWAAGYFGAIYRTTDGGQSWAKLPSGTQKSIYDISFADEKHGWAVGRRGFVIHTTDGGDSWERQDIPRRPSRHIFGIHAIDAKHAWAVGDWGGRYYTADAGETWEDRSFLVYEDHPTFKYLSEAELAAFERGEKVYDDLYMNDIFFLDSERGWIVGEYGIIYRTADGGQTWEKSEIQGDVHFEDIEFPKSASEIPRELWAMLFEASELLLEKEYLRVRIEAFMTPDEMRKTGDTFLADARAESVRDFLEGEGISQDRIRILNATPFDEETVDMNVFRKKKLNDRPFVRIAVLETPFLFDVKFNNRSDGLIAGLGGVLMRSIDGGRSWKYVESDSRQALFAVGFGAQRLVAVGEKGLRRVSSDRGATWETPQQGFPKVFAFMRDADFGTEQRGWIVGGDSLVLRTSDGGLTWEPISIGFGDEAAGHAAGE